MPPCVSTPRSEPLRSLWIVQLERALRELDRGTEYRALQAHLTDLRHVIDAKLASHEERWTGLLDEQLTAGHREHHDEA